MKKLYPFLSIGLLVLFLSSCYTTGALRQKTMKISSGMTKADVLRILGTPGKRSFRGASEAWQYRSIGTWSEHDLHIIWFGNDKVVGHTTESSLYSFAKYKNIDWEKAPDYVVEKRIKVYN